MGKVFRSKNIRSNLSISCFGGKADRTSMCSTGLTWLYSKLDPSTRAGCEKEGGRS